MQLTKHIRLLTFSALISITASLNAQSTRYIVKSGTENGSFSGGVFIGWGAKITGNGTTSLLGTDSTSIVLWKDLIGVAQTGNTLTKTASTGWGNAGGASNNKLDTLENGWIDCKIIDLETVFAFGLSDRNPDESLDSIKYAVMLDSGQIKVYNRGLLIGNFGSANLDDSIRIERLGNVLFYSKNEVVFFNQEIAAKQPLLIDIAIYTSGASVIIGTTGKGDANVNSFFRSAQNGNWNQTATWEISMDSVNWTTSTTIPDNNSKTILIQAIDTVIITDNVAIDEIVVNGTLVYGNTGGSTITVMDGTGTDLIVNGTFQDIGPNSIVWIDSMSSWSLGNGGTLLRTRNTSVDNWRDHYLNGISSIPASAHWIIRKTGVENPLLSSVSGMYYPNLTIENTSGTSWTTSGSFGFTHSTDYPQIKSVFNVGGSGTDSVIFVNQNTDSIPVFIGGNLLVQSGSILHNVGAGFNVKGDVSILGNITGNKNLFLSGNGNQIISGSGFPSINNLTINKSGGAVILGTIVTIDSTLVFQKGIIESDSTNILVINNGATVSGSSDSNYVSGPVKKIGNQAFTFPLGDSALSSAPSHPLSITAPSNSSDAFTAQYFAANQSFGTSLQPDSIESISDCEYWLLTRNVGTSVIVPSVTWNSNSCNIGNYSNLRLSGWNGSQWNLLGNSIINIDDNKGILNGSIGLNVSSLPVLIANSSVEIPNNTIPTTDAGTNKTICLGSQAQLQATGADVYSWYPETGLNNTNISNPVANPDTTTYYYITGTNGNNSVTDSVLITVNNLPELIITNSSDSICSGENVTLTATGEGTFIWQPSSGLSDSTSSSPVANPLESVSYIVKLTDNNGCESTANVDVFVASVSLDTPDTITIEKDHPVQLIAMSNTLDLSWQPGTGLRDSLDISPVASPDSTITYTVTGTLEGCTTQSTIVVNVLEPPLAAYTYSFPGLEVQFSTNNTLPALYSWSFGEEGTSNESSPSHTFSSAGSYNVCLTVTNAVGSVSYCDQIEIE